MTLSTLGRTIAAAVVVALAFSPYTSHAQCMNLTGNPGPEAATNAGGVKFRYQADGPGGGNDRIVLKKSVSGPLVSTPAFDPQNIHTLHVTLSVNTPGGPVLWSASVPPSPGLWAPSGSNGWTFDDPLLSFGVRRIRILPLITSAGQFFVIKQLLTRDQNISNAPLLGTDFPDIQVEVEDAGNGFCFGGPAVSCGGANPSVAQSCK